MMRSVFIKIEQFGMIGLKPMSFMILFPGLKPGAINLETASQLPEVLTAGLGLIASMGFSSTYKLIRLGEMN
jgi:hypothetical protein